MIGALVLGAGLLPAQAAREPHVAIVSDADGKVVHGAEVTFVATEGTGRAVDDDVVRATSNEHGRVRVDLLGGRDYTAYAALAVEGGARLSPLVPRASTTTELVLEAGAPRPQALRLEGLHAWRERGPIEVEFEPFGCTALAQRVPVAEDGTLRVKPLVHHYLQARVFVAGRLVQAGQFFGTDTLSLAPPREIRCRVLDEAGAPVVGAELMRIANGSHGHDGVFPAGLTARRWAVGTSDAQGQSTLLLAHDKDPAEGIDDFPGIVFVASKDGCRETWSGFTSTPFCDGQSVDKKALDGILRFTLRAAATAKVVVSAGGQTPACVIAHIEHIVPDGDGSNNVARDLMTFAVDAQGRFAMRAQTDSCPIGALVVPGTRAPVEQNDPFARLAHPRTMVVPPAAIDAAGGLDLRSLQALRLQFIDTGGGPARGAAVLCSPLCGDHYVPAARAMRATADLAGRVLLPVLPGKWLICALLDGAFVHAELVVQPGLPVQTLRLELLPSATVTVTDGTAPVAGATLYSTGGGWSSLEDPAESFVADMAHHVNGWLLGRVRTDASGNATLRILQAEGVTTRFGARAGGKSWSGGVLAADQHFDLVVR